MGAGHARMTRAHRCARHIGGVGLLLASAACAAPPPPVCSQSEVLRVVADDMARQGAPASFVLGTAGEIPTARPDIVRCAVQVQATTYDTNRYGYAPLARLSTVEYSVRAGRNGLFVQDIGAPR